MPRLACVTVPLFPLAAHLRSDPSLRETAVAVVDGAGNAARVVAATRFAREAGVAPGMSVPQARTLVPGLSFRGRSVDAERAAQEALLEAAGFFSPRVEDAGHGVVHLDVGGLERCLRTRRRSRTDGKSGNESSGEVEVAWGLQAAVRRAGLPARVGIAGTKLAASRAAALVGEPKIVAPGQEAAFLAPLPLELLLVGGGGEPPPASAERLLAPTVRTIAPAPPLSPRPHRLGLTGRARKTQASPRALKTLQDERREDEAAVAALGRWGLRTIGSLAALPAREVATRLGAAGRRLHALARGFDPTPLFPAPPPPLFTEAAELEWSVVTLEPLLAMASVAFERLTRRLSREGLGCLRLELTLRLDPDGHDVRSIALPGPTSCPRTLLDLVRLELDRRSPGAPVTGLTLTAHPDKPRRGQLTLFGPVEVSPERLAAALARLTALLGGGRNEKGGGAGGERELGEREPRHARGDHNGSGNGDADRGEGSEERVGAPRLLDGHRPERLALAPYAPASPQMLASAHLARRASLALRAFRPAVALEVEMEETDDGPRPAALAPGGPVGAAGGGGRGHGIRGPVRTAVGPWWLEETWWAGLPVFRVYWDVELVRGGLFRIFQDPAGPWFADGAYD